MYNKIKFLEEKIKANIAAALRNTYESELSKAIQELLELESALQTSARSSRVVPSDDETGLLSEPSLISRDRSKEKDNGPPDPVSSAKGITMQLKCSTRLDKRTPQYLLHKRAVQLVSLNDENYGCEWFLLQVAEE